MEDYHIHLLVAKLNEGWCRMMGEFIYALAIACVRKYLKVKAKCE